MRAPLPAWRLLAVQLLLTSTLAVASSHREAPLISNDPAADGTDLYAWKQGTSLVLVANYYPIGIPYGGPNYYLFDDNVLYEIQIDQSGDGAPDIRYQFRFRTQIRRSPLPSAGVVAGYDAFKDSFLYAFAGVKTATAPEILRYQTYTLTKVAGAGAQQVIVKDAPVAPDNVGRLTTPAYPQTEGSTTLDAITSSAIQTGLGAASKYKVFAGPRDDPFFVNLSKTFDFLDYSGKPNRDDLAGLNVMSLVIELPLTEFSSPHLGIWTTASRPRVTTRRPDGAVEASGAWVQVSRLGNPLVNEVVVPMKFKDFFNASRPQNDLATPTIVAIINNPELPQLLQAKGFIPLAPPAPRTDLVALFTRNTQGKATGEMLHINTGTDSTFPNGRLLTDDVTDVALKAVGGAFFTTFTDGGPATLPDGGGTFASAASTLGDGVAANDVPFLTTFPYLAPPHSGNPTP
ncbi:DUF4331 domain-containing protein [Myxococcus landrumensis]|uniref:DUF4331 domain-containing protein n=1 Tax=Myxococcus landrumensis TaxID=2813577 RepID=A0ABX7ND25_9BACT|nr:DUF4331 domain-containing protein [Myxococcus landrumus]QSQ15520.1 DUF4331 domain-containing protein [Myxococcus landrumus]